MEGLSGGSVPLLIVPGVAAALATCGEPSDALKPEIEPPVPCLDELPGAGAGWDPGAAGRRRLRGFGGFSGPHPH